MRKGIDKLMCELYGLTEAEIAYIESMIKPMGGDETLFDKDEFELKNNG